ncbi:MAG: VOC family protein [Pseudomonadales bacterium]|nr:VOC family protein [Pseudomonadales bacterium]
MSNPVNWFEIYVQDLERAKAFYETVLGIELSPLPGGPDGQLSMSAFPQNFEHHGAGGALVHAPGMPSGGNSILVYFACEDCAVEAGRVDDAGGQLERDKMSIGEYGFVAHAKDPDGNLFGLHSQQ